MIWNKESFWTFIFRRLAKAQGFLDPVVVFSSLQQFSQPSEVWVPTELLRSGAILQARGLINSQAIQHNLDWVWPFWVNHQFNPQDNAFIPRAFGISHINLSHRNWTAVGIPDFADYPIVDPRGLITPFWDSWSIDIWIMGENQPSLFPSQEAVVNQGITMSHELSVFTEITKEFSMIRTMACVNLENNMPTCKIAVKAKANFNGWLIISVRPYNPEGVSFVYHINKLPDNHGWCVNKNKEIFLDVKPNRYVFTNYHLGDMSQQIPFYYEHSPQEKEVDCPVGMAAAAAMYSLAPQVNQEITVSIPLSTTPITNNASWQTHLENHCKISIPDKHFQFLYDVSIRTLILHTPGDVFPGPFTYKRFWFRDAAYILNALMMAGLTRNIEKIIDHFPHRQTPTGYFKSQDGEWDSNGQVLWIMHRTNQYINTPLKPTWIKSMMQGARWIQKKRLSYQEGSAHSGLLPAGFSAEHFGPNDYYYWDDFWALAGLTSASLALREYDYAFAQQCKSQAMDLSVCIEKSLALVRLRLHSPAIPASPYRRMDGAAIGGLAAWYPLQLYAPNDHRLMATVNYLSEKCFLDGAFYHEVSHSGLNIYLTLHVAQVLLRAQSDQFYPIVKAVARLATSTGQWPEAIHPRTKGGCMGDGQHVWATAEWVCMIRNMFVREEEATKTLILCSGIPTEWLDTKENMYLGPTLTIFGKITVTIKHEKNVIISWEAQWNGAAPTLEVHLTGYKPFTIQPEINEIQLKPQDRVVKYEYSPD